MTLEEWSRAEDIGRLVELVATVESIAGRGHDVARILGDEWRRELDQLLDAARYASRRIVWLRQEAEKTR